MTRLLFATLNRGKLRELRQILAGIELELLGLADLGDTPEVVEDAETFAGNARKKAVAMMRATGLPTIADDSGLEVDALDGRPGVRSARYAGVGASDADRVVKLLGELRGVPRARRTARFRCAVAYVHPAEPARVELREAACEGWITERPSGENGFGYDPVFFVDELGQTFAEAPAADKNRLSHRGKALRQMAAVLRDRCR